MLHPTKLHSPSIEPRTFQHFCNACMSLGGFLGKDLYWCSGMFGGTVIVRFGNKAHEYASWDLLTCYQIGESGSTLNAMMLEAVSRIEKIAPNVAAKIKEQNRVRTLV